MRLYKLLKMRKCIIVSKPHLIPSVLVKVLRCKQQKPFLVDLSSKGTYLRS